MFSPAHSSSPAFHLPASAPVLRVGTRGEVIQFNEVTLELRTRGALRRILLALVDHHRSSPGAALSVEAMFAAGWPEDRVELRAARARVYTAMYTLRGMGLRDVIVRRDDGYYLDDVCTVEPLERAMRSAS